MRRKSWLAGASLVLALGPGAGTALAAPSDVRVGQSQLLISEVTPVAPAVQGPNDITVTRSGNFFTVRDTAGVQITPMSTTCQQPDANTAICEAQTVQRINVQPKDGTDKVAIDGAITTPTTILAGKGNDTILGGGGPDTVRGDAGADIISTGAGDDSIDTRGETSPEADTITCGAGNDTATIDLRDGFIPAANSGECETVNRPGQQPPPPPPPPGPGGGGGATGPQPSPNQTAVQPLPRGQIPNTVPRAPSGVRCNSQAFLGTPEADRFVGTAGGDRMAGLAGNDLFDGLGGSDCIFGQDGADTMRGGDGDDRLSGGAGNDLGDGGDGSDSVYGSAGVDTLHGRVGNDTVSGGTGSDRLYGQDGRDNLSGSAGNDRLSAGTGNDRIVAGSGRDQVFGSAGNDLIDVRDGSRDVVSCGSGRDTVVRDRRDVLRNCERRASRLPRRR
jgi:Ca2+-binding RTX toxin-like protein